MKPLYISLAILALASAPALAQEDEHAGHHPDQPQAAQPSAPQADAAPTQPGCMMMAMMHGQGAATSEGQGEHGAAGSAPHGPMMPNGSMPPPAGAGATSQAAPMQCMAMMSQHTDTPAAAHSEHEPGPAQQ
jgi:hypothetical protein